jgi:hypothetical protein
MVKYAYRLHADEVVESTARCHPCFCGLVLPSGKSAKKSPNQPQFSVKLFFSPLGYNGLCLQRTGRFMISPIILSLLVGILGLLGGAVLGLCFRVYVLVLAIMLALVVVAGAGVAAEAGLRWIALDVFVVTMCLQLGYIAGSVFKARRASLREAQRPGYDNPPPGDEHVNDDDEDKLSGRSHEAVFGGFGQFDAQQIEVGRNC